MKRNLILLAILLLNATMLCAQLSPVFNHLSVTNAAKDSRSRVFLSPKKILWKSDDTGKYIHGAENILKPGNGQAELVNKDLVMLKSDDTVKPGILLDYGKELHGGLQLVTGMMDKNAPVKVRIRFGESASEAMADIDTLTGATNDHAIRDLVIDLPWLGGLELGNTGFRFVRIDLVDANSTLLLKEARAIFTFRDIPYAGSFRSNDERLNQVWATGAYTVHLNMQQYLWDGIKRDRLVWVGDMHPEVMTINTVFGFNEIVPQSLDLIKEVTPLPAWMNGISSYSMWWIRIQRDWFLYQGDLTYLEKQQDYLVALLNQLIGKIKGNKEDLDGMRFMDWPTFSNKPAVHAGLQAMMVMTLTDGAELCRILGDLETAKKCEAAVKRLRKGAPDAGGNKQAAALLALADLIPAEKANREVIAIGGTKDFSTFYGYYMLEAKAKAGDYQGAIDNIRTYWGGMLDMGATTFWEDFDEQWMENAARIDELVPKGKIDIHAAYGAHSYKKLRHSLAHGWASGPTSWLTQHVLGVKVMEPGCKVLKIDPHLGDLKFVEGTFPTPFGIVKIKHTKMADGRINSVIDAPNGITVIK
ncbi:alpha-L-rhamnosidase [Pedobacter sp.]|uniref:alpha-L-rhamnosidase-related protein n=1 Tax=Pedobacter sp. TaxID=1411316 RepID=UPI003D7F86FB